MKEERCICCGEIIPEGQMVCMKCEEDAANVCNCYDSYNTIDPVNCYVLHKKSVCYGTKELDPCSCGGDMSKCDFYPEKREKITKVREALALKQLKADAAKLGYHLIKDPEKVIMLPCPLCGKKKTSSGVGREGMYRVCKCGFQGKRTTTWTKTKLAWNEAVEEYLKGEDT